MTYILIGVVVLLVMLVIVIAMQPDDFHYERSAKMNAAPAAVFTHVNDLQKWDAWSPWAKMDPDAKTTFEGPQSGLNAAMSWDGKKTGQGKMTIIDSQANEQVKFKLEFYKPMAGVSTATFTFKPDNGGTLVSWGMEGKSNFIGKAMSLLMNCGKMMNTQFDSGLANLKTIVEK